MKSVGSGSENGFSGNQYQPKNQSKAEKDETCQKNPFFWLIPVTQKSNFGYPIVGDR